ncbi:aldose 1-epimerase [Rhizobium sp. SSA_523]|uniref:aldose epimerase family protein n=1 Tax=Rhizobium sp. SSA_523 TaxID=2952477 RepID=UPI002090F21C|nr:aldose 1-epimerase [Rhizobium sp. SSA_523]MCO5731158.1 aldose 1-epimerase [Rhizobium sp. SSA_523]WKC22297.1 aldose 1-epimerase [Rhizobium sp. SSA_523]
MPSPDARNAAGDVTIGESALRAAFRPAAGGRMSRLWHRDLGDILVPMSSEPFAPFEWPKAGAYPLFPFHNRVRGGVLRHAGKSYRLAPHPALKPDGMHGPAHRRVWTVSHRDRNAIGLVLDYAADEDWPFDFRAEQDFAIDGDRLTVALRLINTGRDVMPGGLGWHPYFDAALFDRASTDAKLTYPLDGQNLPNGAAPELRRKDLLPDVAGYTIHLAAWSRAQIVRDRGFMVEMTYALGLPHLAVHRMPDYLCLEPVSHRAGALDRASLTEEEEGLAEISPGRWIEARFAVEVRGLGSRPTE